MSPFAKAFFVAILSFSQTFLASSACQGDDCKVEAPQDEVSLIQTKMEPKQPHRPSDDMLDAAKEAIAEEVEEGKKQLRAYVDGLKSQGEAEQDQNSGFHNASYGPPAGVSFSATCPANWNMAGPNLGVQNFINTCLSEVTLQSAGAKLRGILDSGCSGPGDDQGGHAQPGKLVQMSGGNTWKLNFKGAGAGGVCSAKVYTGKCSGNKFSDACKNTKLYRVFQNGRGAYSDYWVAQDPSTWGTKDDFRNSVAICKSWNAMDNIATYTLNDNACNLIFIIGNGEAVQDCGTPLESYEYSTALQIGVCPYQPGAMTQVKTKPWPTR